MANTAVFGIYPDRESVEAAVTQLQEAGFRNTDISVLVAHNVGSKDFGVEKHTKAPEGTAAGATTGFVVGGVLGWLAGAGTLAVPGIGPLLAAGPIMAALAGAGAGGVVGALAGAMVGMGVPEYEARRYEGRIRRGGILLSVHADDAAWSSKAKQLLERTGARDISSTGEAKADFAKTRKPRVRTGSRDEVLGPRLVGREPGETEQPGGRVIVPPEPQAVERDVHRGIERETGGDIDEEIPPRAGTR